MTPRAHALAAALGLALGGLGAHDAPAAPLDGWGALPSRSMASPARDLPGTLTLEPGRGLKWQVELGGQTYSSPIVSQGRVLIGTNNDRPRDPRVTGDAGVLLCLDAATGALKWQLVSHKVGGNPYNDWPGIGLPSPATVEGERVYVLTNRNEVACLDLQGLANGNGGPYTDEARYRTRPGVEPVPLAATDADILWMFDVHAECRTHRHDAAHASVLPAGPFLFVNTSNGVTDDHGLTPNPEAPAFIALHKATGRLAARDTLRLGPATIHNHWASPAAGALAGRSTVVFGGGDGVCYGFAPPARSAAGADWQPLWRFDCDPDAPKQDIFRWQENRREGPSTIQSMPVVEGGRVYVVAGGDYWHGKPASWLRRLRPRPGGPPVEEWCYPVTAHVMATPALGGGLVYLTDVSGVVHCIDAATGKAVWRRPLGQEVWGSPLLADGKLYVGTRLGTVFVLAAGRTASVLSSVRLDGPIHGSPCAADGVLYVATMRQLYAFSRPATSGARKSTGARRGGPPHPGG